MSGFLFVKCDRCRKELILFPSDLGKMKQCLRCGYEFTALPRHFGISINPIVRAAAMVVMVPAYLSSFFLFFLPRWILAKSAGALRRAWAEFREG